MLAVERVTSRQTAVAEAKQVYNFTVKGPHTYFVLEVGVLVHNAGCIDENESGLRGDDLRRMFPIQGDRPTLTDRLNAARSGLLGVLPHLERRLQDFGLEAKQIREVVSNLQQHFLDNELRYIDEAIGGKLNRLLDDVECYGAALCLPKQALGLNVIPNEEGYIFRSVERSDMIGAVTRDWVEHSGLTSIIEERQLNNWKLANEYSSKDMFIRAIADGELQPGDFVVYTDLSKRFEGEEFFDEYLRDIVPEHLPIHGNRFLGEVGLSDNVKVPLFFNKTNKGFRYPFEIVDLDQVFKLWDPTSIQVYRPYR